MRNYWILYAMAAMLFFFCFDIAKTGQACLPIFLAASAVFIILLAAMLQNEAS